MGRRSQCYGQDGMWRDLAGVKDDTRARKKQMEN